MRSGPVFSLPEYPIWAAMVQRCTNPRDKSFARYGGRGISVCQRWLKFSAFYEDMGQRPDGLTLERVDNDGGYGPNNCRWATPTEQGRNKRLYKTSTTGVAGVNYRRDSGKYRALISIDGRQITLGHFDSVTDAAEARKQAEVRYWNKPT